MSFTKLIIKKTEKYLNMKNNNKTMPSKEIGLYRMAKEKKAMHEAKELVEKATTMALAMKMAKMVK